MRGQRRFLLGFSCILAQEGSGTRAACAELGHVLCYRLVHQPSMVFKSWQTGRAELFEEICERKQAKAMQGLIQLKTAFVKAVWKKRESVLEPGECLLLYLLKKCPGTCTCRVKSSSLRCVGQTLCC